MSTRGATGEVKVVLSANITNTMVNGQIATANHGDILATGKLRDGVSENQFNRVWEDERSLASAASEDIDFYDLGTIDIGGGAGKDSLGQALSFEEIMCVAIKQISGTGRLQINATDPTNKLTWMPTLTVANGGALRNDMLLLFHSPGTDGLDVSDGVSHMVRFGASGGTVVYSITIFGRHDDDESSSSTSSTLSSSSSSSSSTTSTLSSLSSTSTLSSSSSTQSTKSSLSSSSSSTLSSSSSSTLSSSSSTSSVSSSSSHSRSSSSSLSSSSSSLSSSSSSSSSRSRSTSSSISSSSTSSVSSSSSSSSTLSSSSSSSSSLLQ